MTDASLREILNSRFGDETPARRARSYVHALVLAQAIHALAEQSWIFRHEKRGADALDTFLARVRASELAPLSFVDELFTDSTTPIWKERERAANEVAEHFSRGSGEPRDFLAASFREMQRFVRAEAEASRNEGILPSVLYRAFDGLDEVLGFRYERPETLSPAGEASERLYANSGRGVQTSYQSLILLLEVLPKHAHLIDLGSGFGRVGITAGLCREDLRCTGYEYVSSRVDMANVAAARAGIDDRVRFIAQDLADPNFHIPVADAYYLYDPFSAETYRHVMAQLKMIATKNSVIVVTKADAGAWCRDLVAGPAWAEPSPLDGGTLLVFRSRPVSI